MHLTAISLAAGAGAWCASEAISIALNPGYLTMGAQLVTGGSIFTAVLLGLAHTTGLAEIATQLKRLTHH